MPIKPGKTNWIHNPLKYLEVDDLLKRQTPRQQFSKNADVDVVEIPYRVRKLVKAVLVMLIPEKESKPKIEAFLKRQDTSGKIIVHGRMNLFCSFFYYLVDYEIVKAEMKSMESSILTRFKFLKVNGEVVTEGSIKNIFKKGNQKKKEVKSTTANKGARLTSSVVIDRIFKHMKGSDALDVKRQLEKLFSKPN